MNSKTLHSALEVLLPRMTGRGLWARGGEWNTLTAQEFEKRPLRVLISRLSTYADTAESFTHTLLYQTLASVPGVYPDLAYLPPPRDGRLLSEAGLPWLFGTQSKHGPEGFDVIALSNAIVQELVNLPTLLQNSGLLLPRAERFDRADLPLLILGGANSFHASLLDHADSPIDGIFIGDSLDDIQDLFRLCADGKAKGLSKREVLQSLEGVPGFAQPGSNKPTKKRNTETLDIRRLRAPRPVLYKTEGLGQEPVAISRGCPAFCSFCAESFDLKPYRENPQDAVVQNAMQLKREMGLEGVDLFSFNFNFYEDLYPLLEKLGDKVNAIGLKSQRFDMIARDPGILGYLRALGKGSYTFGMEGVSARLRRYLQKGLEEDDLWKALQAVFKHQVRELKVFMIATGIEVEEDFLEFAEFMRRLPEVMRVAEHPPKITFSATPLVRFPWTPLEFAKSPPPEAYAPITRRLAQIVERAGFQWREAAEEADNYVSQVLVRADRPTYWQALTQAVAKTGFVFYRTMDQRFMTALRQELADLGLPDELTLAGGDLVSHADKPWARHETGVRRNFLWLQYKRAARYEDKGYCLGTTEKEGTCFACDSCETEADTEFLVHQRTSHGHSAAAFTDQLKRARQRCQPLTLAVRWGGRVAGLPRKYPGLLLASACMKAAPELTDGFWRYRSSWQPGDDGLQWAGGDDAVVLEWRPEAAERLLTLAADPTFLHEVNARLTGWAELLAVHAGDTLETLPGQPDTWVFQSSATPSLTRFSQMKGLPFTQMRRETGYAAVFSKDALKKKWLQSVAWHQVAEAWHVEVKPLPKFQLDTFLRESFVLPDGKSPANVIGMAKGLWPALAIAD
jgi:radical SAM superfamily enzyme YgiQ (UPF0313 family)